MSTPKQPAQQPIPISENEGYDSNMDNGIRQQNKIPNTNGMQLKNYNAPACISKTALYSYCGNSLFNDIAHFVPRELMGQPPLIQLVFNIEEVSNGVVHPITNKTITKYHKLIDDPILREVWMKAMCVELCRLAQRYKYTKGTETFKFMTWKETNQIPADQKVTYAIIVVD